jgi:predicted MFS family arabinose efflux permease
VGGPFRRRFVHDEFARQRIEQARHRRYVPLLDRPYPARTLSIYLFVMAAGYTVGSLVWGRVADHFGVQAAFATAGACVIINAIVLALARREKPL